MKYYANHFLTTGRLAQVYNLPDGMSPFEVPGTAVIELAGPLEKPADWRVIEGELVFSPIPPSPSPGYTWNEQANAWQGTAADAWHHVRIERSQRIAQTDWTQLPDVPEATRQLWAPYRQALRDITTQTDPLNIVWPKKPGIQ